MSCNEGLIVTGYYRYTDIWFEWNRALGPVGEIVKAILAHDAVTDINHPLHPGQQGIDMFLGTFETGESRLLFSSKQVDYVRYWLHAMKLTENLVPLPYSDCLLLASDLKTISPVTYKDGGSLRNAIKEIQKNNKRLRRSNAADALTRNRDTFERMRSLWRAKKGTFCSVDFEAWERDHTLLTEFGWSIIRFGADGTPSEEQGHLIVEEAAAYRNSTYVPDRREHYDFGISQTLKLKAFKNRIRELFAELKQNQPIFLIFYDDSQDLKYLEQIEVDLTSKTYELPVSMPENGLYIVDASDMVSALLGDAGKKKSLDQTCRLLQVQIQKEHLHNAGNDAHATLLAMKNMAEGDPVDIQREKRWPGQTTIGVQVELKPWQEDSDYSDEEGLYGFLPVQEEKKEENHTASDA